jgi:hypothetical protein
MDQMFRQLLRGSVPTTFRSDNLPYPDLRVVSPVHPTLGRVTEVPNAFPNVLRDPTSPDTNVYPAPRVT